MIYDINSINLIDHKFAPYEDAFYLPVYEPFPLINVKDRSTEIGIVLDSVTYIANIARTYY